MLHAIPASTLLAPPVLPPLPPSLLPPRRLNKCGAISPRFDIASKDIEAWVGRLLPSRQVRVQHSGSSSRLSLRPWEEGAASGGACWGLADSQGWQIQQCKLPQIIYPLTAHNHSLNTSPAPVPLPALPCSLATSS